MIAIIDYGAGNLLSVKNALDKLGFNSQIVNNPVELEKADRAILPGVGAFGSCMSHLKKSRFPPAIRDFIGSGRPFLGICVGLQLLFTESEETFGAEPNPMGLRLIPGRVRKFPPKVKIPQIGWNQIRVEKPSALFKGLGAGFYCYLVHSYYVDPENTEDVLCTTDYGLKYCSGIQRDNLVGLQFHPEKSGEVGLAILKNFGEM